LNLAGIAEDACANHLPWNLIRDTQYELATAFVRQRYAISIEVIGIELLLGFFFINLSSSRIGKHLAQRWLQALQ